jgi:hypothetical protein
LPFVFNKILKLAGGFSMTRSHLQQETHLQFSGTDARRQEKTFDCKMPQLLAQQICGLVKMSDLLTYLGFKVNERTRRGPCLLHGGNNPTSFSCTDDGRWHCHACGKGGDKLALIQAVRNCSFKEALQFLAGLAGVDATLTPELRRELEQRRRKRRRLERAAQKLLAIEQSVMLDFRDEIHRLEGVRRNAGRRLACLRRGGKERFAGECEAAWTALESVSLQMPHLVVGYYISALACQAERVRFALQPEQREEMIEDVLIKGLIKTGDNSFMEIIL